MGPLLKLVVATGVGLTWGMIAVRLCASQGRCDAPSARSRQIAQRPDVLLPEALAVAKEEAIFRLPVSKNALRLAGVHLAPRTAQGLVVAQAVAFGAVHLTEEMSPGEKAVRFIDTAMGGYFYGKLANRWGIGYAVAAHIAHNIGTRL